MKQVKNRARSIRRELHLHRKQYGKEAHTSIGRQKHGAEVKRERDRLRKASQQVGKDIRQIQATEAAVADVSNSLLAYGIEILPWIDN